MPESYPVFECNTCSGVFAREEFYQRIAHPMDGFPPDAVARCPAPACKGYLSPIRLGSATELTHDDVSYIVNGVARVVVREGTSDGTYPLDVFGRIQQYHRPVISYLEEQHPEVDPYQAMKWFLPDDLGYSVS